MVVYAIARYEVRGDDAAERAMQDQSSRIR